MNGWYCGIVALICAEFFAKGIMERLLYLTYFLIKIKADGRVICPKRSGIKSTTLQAPVTPYLCNREYMKDQYIWTAEKYMKTPQLYTTYDQFCLHIFLCSLNIWSFICSLASSPSMGILWTHSVTGSKLVWQRSLVWIPFKPFFQA